MRAEANISRRDMVSALGALILGVYVPDSSKGGNTAFSDADIFKPNVWIRITSDNRVTVLTAIPELGQGTRTANVMALADELEVSWSSIEWEQAPTLPQEYKFLSTGGSGGLTSTYLPMRKAGAQAREMLIAAAAQEWTVKESDCAALLGTVVHRPTGRSLKYGELVAFASKLSITNVDHMPLKEAKAFRYIGKPIARLDIPGKVDGTARFGMDVRVPGMLFAVIARCPHFGGRLVTFDDSAVSKTSGIKAVFAIAPIGFTQNLGRNPGVAGGVAVIATSTWAALEGRKALKITWDKAGQESTASLKEQFQEKLAGAPTVVSVERGHYLAADAGLTRRIQADYELPFQAHATMETMNTTVHVHEDGHIEIWSPTQIADAAQKDLADFAGTASANVTVHMTLSGGSFGRRYQWDYLLEAYQAAKEMKVPVQLLWTREDDIQHDFYRQYACQRVTGELDPEGNIVSWEHRIVSTPIRAVFDSAEALKDPKHVASQDTISADTLPYLTARYRVDYAPVLSAVPRAWWRSVSDSFHAFAIECFVDELAQAIGEDPYQFRIKRLRTDQSQQTAKLRGVLELAAIKSEWSKPLPLNYGRGLACWTFGGTCVANVAEVSIKSGVLRVHRVISAIDCGLAVNPDSVRAQIEGGINFALTPVLSGEITIEGGAVVQSNFHNYQVLRMKDAPEIEVYISDSKADPGDGVGEAGVPPLAPAVANAIFAASGKRVRRLPVSKLA